MAKKKITEIVEALASDFLKENSYELYHAEFVKEGRDWFLRVYIDLAEATDKYVSTEDCEKVSRFLSAKLDEEDPIEQNYFLEVSSPGMDRPLIKPEHYEKYIGSTIEVKLYKAIDGVKNMECTLEAFAKKDEGYVLKLRDEADKVWELELSDIAKARLAVIF